MPPRSTLTPWIENLILSYGSRDEAGSGSTGGLLRAHVITVGQMTESQARDFDGPTGLIFLSDGLLQIPAVLTASAWERLQELEERECFRSLLNTTVLMRDYRLQFHMDPEVSRCRFFLSVGELATHSAGPVRDCTPCCTSLESVRTKIWRTWRSLLGQDCSQQPCSPDELDLTELLEEWQQDVLQTLLQDVRERLAALRRPQPSTSGRSPSLSCCRSAAATGWDADRVRYRGEPSFSVPASCLLIPEEDARRLEAETGGSGQTAGADASSAEHAQSQMPEPAVGQTEQDAGGGMMSDPGGPVGGMDPGGSGGPGGGMMSDPGGPGGGMMSDPGGPGGGMDPGGSGGPGGPGGGMMSDPGGRMDPGGSGRWMVSDPGGGMTSVPGGPGDPGGGMDPGGPGRWMTSVPGGSGERSPPLLEDAAPLPDLTAGLLSNPWDMFPPPGVSSSTSDSSPEPTPTLPCSQPDPVAVATSTQLPVQTPTAPASCSTGPTPPEPPASEVTESAVLENHGRPKRKLCDVTAEEPDLRGSPPSWLLGSRSGESSANEDEGGPSGSVPRRTPSVHGDGTPFSYSYRVLGQNLEDVSRFGVATSLLHWALRYLLTPEPAEHPQSVD
ncbi:collagen alpha-1(III) chain isoform X3 [Fundulus heteroclitus]|uniref:collagen alpha-1(III) chain isoform X3 n=1 Tax=Fundulus heteroclitus TaxID=8078 RepID=UPI00165C03DA|nr:collagen alpha-1(III) chain isoform X3 [Fundulus heteroclitus]